MRTTDDRDLVRKRCCCRGLRLRAGTSTGPEARHGEEVPKKGDGEVARVCSAGDCPRRNGRRSVVARGAQGQHGLLFTQDRPPRLLGQGVTCHVQGTSRNPGPQGVLPETEGLARGLSEKHFLCISVQIPAPRHTCPVPAERNHIKKGRAYLPSSFIGWRRISK